MLTTALYYNFSDYNFSAMACSTMQQFHLPLSDGEDNFLFEPQQLSDWDLYKGVNGRLSHGDDVQILQEMMDAVEEEHNKEFDRKIRILGEALEVLDKAVMGDAPWYARRDSWTSIYPGPPEPQGEWPKHRVFAHLMLWPLPEEIVQVLEAAEEDFEYEAWLNSKQYVKSLEAYNMHKLLAFEKGQSPHWAGECTGDRAVATVITSEEVARSDTQVPSERCVLYNTSLKERYRVDAIVRTNFPDDRKNGYAKASSAFGDIYIPAKFRGYIGEPGSPQLMTIALQDVGSSERKGNGFRWTCIYTH